MTDQSIHPLEQYKKAFNEFSGAQETDYVVDQRFDTVVHYEGKTYRVCHYDDLLKDFKTYFNHYDLIYTEIPSDLWEMLFERHNDITEEDLIIDLYNAWKIYWEQQVTSYNNPSIHQLKKQSWEEFQLLIEQVKSGPGSFISKAVDISDITFIPIIAIALRSQYKDEQMFYHECLKLQIEEFSEYFSIDGNFDQINLKSDSYSSEDAFFIYEIENNMVN